MNVIKDISHGCGACAGANCPAEASSFFDMMVKRRQRLGIEINGIKVGIVQ